MAFVSIFKRCVKTILPFGIVQWLMRRRDTPGYNSNPFALAFTNKKAALEDGRFSCLWEDRWPCLHDATETTDFDAHYTYHPAWAARKIAQNMPKSDASFVHVDISSKLDFAAILSAFVPVKFYDYRPAELSLPNLHCDKADLMALPFLDASLISLSCMHVVEHIGLERYGDPFDPKGDLKAIQELVRVLAHGGHLYFVVPVGCEALIQYNAHRIYTYQQIIDSFRELELLSFSFISDSSVYIESAAFSDTKSSKYGCGCFEFYKRP